MTYASHADYVEAVRTANPLAELMAEFYGKAPGPMRSCPWHDDSTPSLSVNSTKGVFYCFGCQIKGDVFSLTELHERLSFAEALAYLAQRAGLPPYKALPAERVAVDAARDADFVTERVAEYYAERLSGADVAQKYLVEERAIPQDFLVQYSLGWADGGATAWIEANYGPDWLPAMETAGLASPVTNDYRLNALTHRDWLFGRVTFPCLRRGSPVFISGRAIDPNVHPKYLHQRGREAPLYPEDDGLPSDRAYLVEGPLDALSLRAWGYPAYALQGGMRAGAVRRLRGVRELYACFDGDKAGQETSLRLAAGLGLDRVKVVALPSGEDPNDLLRRGVREVFDSAVTEAYDPLSYALRGIETPLTLGNLPALTPVLQLLTTASELYTDVALETIIKPRLKLTRLQTDAARKDVARRRAGANLLCPACGTALHGR